MLKPNELEAVSTAYDKQMRELENRIMQDIIRRLKANGNEITRSADWQINRLYELGLAKTDIKKSIAESLNLSDKEMLEMYKKIVKSGYERDRNTYLKAGGNIIPFEENLALQQMLSAVSEQTFGTLKNITNSLGFSTRNEAGKLEFKPIAEYYQQTFDGAMFDIASGAFDYNTVLQRVVNEMTNSGLRTVDYATGWANRVDVAARRAVMTGVSQLTAKVNEDNAKVLDTEYFEVSWHGGARPSHQEWQGKVYSKEQLVSVCGWGEVDGLCGANCYHDYYPFIPGISERTYTDEQLAEMNREENTPKEFCGRQYTKYEALQRQRRLETTMRAQKQKINLLEVGGADEKTLLTAKVRYRTMSYEYTRFSKAMDLPQQRERVRVSGDFVAKVGAKRNGSVSGDERLELLKNPNSNRNIDYMSKSFRPEYSQNSRTLHIGSFSIETKAVENSNFNLLADVDESRRSKAVRLTERNLLKAKEFLPKEFELPTTAVVNFEKHGLNPNAIAGFERNSGIMYINSKYDTSEKILEFVNKNKGQFANNTELAPILHELGHNYYENSVKALAKAENMEYNKAKNIIDGRIYDYIHERNTNGNFIENSISGYAEQGFIDHKFTEIIAECFSVRNQNIYADEILKLLR